MHLKVWWTGWDWYSSAWDTEQPVWCWRQSGEKMRNEISEMDWWRVKGDWVSLTPPLPLPKAQNRAWLKCYESLTAIFCSFFIILCASFSIFFLCCSMERFSRSTIFCCLFREQKGAQNRVKSSFHPACSCGQQEDGMLPPTGYFMNHRWQCSIIGVQLFAEIEVDKAKAIWFHLFPTDGALKS